MASVAPAWAVINIGEGSVEVSIGFHQVRGTVGGEIGVHIVYVYPITQDVVGKDVATCGVGRAAFVTGQDATHGNAQGDVYHVISQAPAVGETGPTTGEQPQAAGAAGCGGRHAGV